MISRWVNRCDDETGVRGEAREVSCFPKPFEFLWRIFNNFVVSIENEKDSDGRT